MKKVLCILTLLVLHSCASYVDKLHRMIDSDEKRQQMAQNKTDPFSAYKHNPFKRKQFDKRPINDPQTYAAAQAQQEGDMEPQIKRQYVPQRRHTVNDLQDNEYAGSLWAGQDKESFLFSENKSKALGDIIIVDVLEDMKNNISNELKRVFPKDEPKKPDPTKKGADAAPAAAAATNPNPAANDKDEGDGEKIYDKISTQVVEIISKDYILVRGRKEVLFRKQKHYVDFQGLIAKRDITNNDTITSDKVLESQINILR